MSQPNQPKVLFPHVARIDLKNDGTVFEVVVVKENKQNGDVYFIRTDYLDPIDRKRMQQILARRNAAQFELWDLLDQIVLPNGVNALEFFHQFVQVRSKSGKIFRPSLTRMGAGYTQQQLNDSVNQQNQPQVKKSKKDTE